MSVWMVERDLRAISMATLAQAQGAAIAEAGKATAQGTPVRYLRSIFTPEDRRCYLFEAASPEAVRQVNDAAGLPYKRVAEALDLLAPG
jgi:hypothetical protein